MEIAVDAERATEIKIVAVFDETEQVNQYVEVYAQQVDNTQVFGVITIADFAVNENAAGGVYVKTKGENNEFARGQRVVAVTEGVNVVDGSVIDRKLYVVEGFMLQQDLMKMNLGGSLLIIAE